jgi:mannose-6-phosphate isomerase-like protein (cupin superfamily)
MKILKFPLILILACNVNSSSGQKILSDTIGANASYDNLYNRELFSDSLCSSFVILIKKEVKEHKHAYHSEHVYVIEGEAEMTLGDGTFRIKKGDVIFIPKNTFHSVKVISAIPLKILSVQSPQFDGSDRIYK